MPLSDNWFEETRGLIESYKEKVKKYNYNMSEGLYDESKEYTSLSHYEALRGMEYGIDSSYCK